MSRAPWHDDAPPARRWRVRGAAPVVRRLAWLRGELADAQRGGRAADVARWQSEIDAATGQIGRTMPPNVDMGGDRPNIRQAEIGQTPVPTQEDKNDEQAQ